MIRTLLLFILATATLGAQSLIVTKADTIVYGNSYTTADIASDVYIKNISNDTLDVKVRRVDKNYNLLTDNNAICWSVCFQESVSVSPISLTLYPGDETDDLGFKGHVYPDQDGVDRQGDITYVFFDMNNPKDSVAVTITYATTQTFGTRDMKMSQTLEVFPNPASDKLQVQYELDGKGKKTIEIVNLVGNTVYRKNLNNAKGQISLDVSSLARGVYFYVLRSDQETVISKKLILR